MTKKDFLKEMDKHLGVYLSGFGFKIKQDGTIQKTSKDMIWLIQLTFENWGTVHVDNIFTSVKVKSLEKACVEIYYPFLSESLQKSRYQGQKTLVGPIKKVNKDIFQIIQVNSFAVTFKEYFENEFLPFFNSYSDVQSINRKYDEMDVPYQDGIGYVGDYDQIEIYNGFSTIFSLETLGRRILLMKYSKDSRYEDYIKWLKNCIEAGQLDSVSVKIYDRVLPELMSFQCPEIYQ
ncbi:hypothetical protein [Flectobacillus roseus]|uniref:hypothetical protein n=1 Tax=Flectobacillus roseus TaxID=502259 RepID=UPI0024B6A807|nr:hypothetical protein [Flectobacillus roseus]MDI9871681.1 hypothetical protein [Flectobacillus roseus]